ncbi:hypothetical protein QJS10_CPA03g01298 [Acorus calamus]|uniref:Uncharacterized protein n=1 Tax=Acorus calamus TaxID=4465 RepID=A0AAV9F9S4_ACOCL|nr:hypothetical protein QJS10_CPA03g01298 [Acorus calamus]
MARKSSSSTAAGEWCRDIISDQTNCGSCGNRCGNGQLCCRGKCTVVAYDDDNCDTRSPV